MTKLTSLSGSLPLLALLALACAPAAQAQNAPLRVGFVSTERLYSESTLAKSADSRIEAEFSKREKANRELRARLKTVSEKFDSDANTLVEPERTRRARAVLELDKEVQRVEQEFAEDLQQRKNDERASIANRAFKSIERIAEQQNLDVVLTEALWVNRRIDITDSVLKRLDQ
ncbi:MAG: OmpH family outer membrane protein [Massilia sp.]